MTKKQSETKKQAETKDPFEDSEGWQQATAVIWQPEEGQELMGTYDGNKPFTEGEFEQQALQHFIIEWGSLIRHSFVGGQVFDKTLANHDIDVGDLVRIKYLGQKITKKDRRVNLFDVTFKKT